MAPFDTAQLVILLLMAGYTIYYLRGDMLQVRTQIDYENEFLDRHADSIEWQQHQNCKTYRFDIYQWTEVIKSFIVFCGK